MKRASSDAGFTLLEMLVVLAILAAMTVVLAGSIRPTSVPSSTSATSETSIAALRHQAVLSGVPQLLTIGGAELSPKVREVLTNLAGDTSPSGASLVEATVTIVAYPDGGLATKWSTDGQSESSMQLSAKP